MGFIRFLVWTAMCIGLGIFVASWEVDGKTPAQHLKTIWRGAPKLDLEKAKRMASSVTSKDEPTESHSDSDRDAVNRLVAKRGPK